MVSYCHIRIFLFTFLVLFDIFLLLDFIFTLNSYRVKGLNALERKRLTGGSYIDIFIVSYLK